MGRISAPEERPLHTRPPKWDLAMPRGGSNRMRGPPGLHDGGENSFDLLLKLAPGFAFRQRDADALRPITCGMRGIDPGYRSHKRNLCRFVEKAEHHQHLIAQLVHACRLHEQTAALEKRHIGRIEG